MKIQATLADMIEDLYEMPRIIESKPLECCFMLGAIAQRLQIIHDYLEEEKNDNDNQLHGC